MARGFPDWSMGAYLVGKYDPLLNFLQWAARNRADKTSWVATTCYTDVAPCKKTLVSVPTGYAAYVISIDLQISSGSGVVDFYVQPAGSKIWSYRGSSWVEKVKEFTLPLSLGEGDYIEAEIWPDASVTYMTVSIYTRHFLEAL